MIKPDQYGRERIPKIKPNYTILMADIRNKVQKNSKY